MNLYDYRVRSRQAFWRWCLVWALIGAALAILELIR